MDAAAAEWDLLAQALAALGIRHLAPTMGTPAPIQPRELISRLLTAHAPRLREAIVPLLLTRSDFAVEARAAIAKLPSDRGLQARLRYCAACCLQRMWWTRLASDLGPRPAIEPAYWDELDLPPLERDFGRDALLELCAREQAAFGYDAWTGYASLMDLVLAQIAVDSEWGRSLAPAS